MDNQTYYPQNFVSLIQDDEVRIERVTPEFGVLLRDIGGTERQLSDRKVWFLHASDDVSLGRLLGQLRDMGFLFVDQPGGWPPAAIFDELRERGLVSGVFQAVSWRNPRQWCIRVR